MTPNPFTSGGARWNVMAAYGAQLRNERTPAQAIAETKDFPGVTGRITIVPQRNARKSAVVVKRTGGVPVAVATIEPV